MKIRDSPVSVLMARLRCVGSPTIALRLSDIATNTKPVSVIAPVPTRRKKLVHSFRPIQIGGDHGDHGAIVERQPNGSAGVNRSLTEAAGRRGATRVLEPGHVIVAGAIALGLSHPAGYRTAMDIPELLVGNPSEWRRWLQRNHSTSKGVWLVLAKKGTTEPTTLSYDQALEEAICFGWIDGQLKSRDEATFRRRFTPRKCPQRLVKKECHHRGAVASPRGECIDRAKPRLRMQRQTVGGRPPMPDKPRPRFLGDLQAAPSSPIRRPGRCVRNTDECESVCGPVPHRQRQEGGDSGQTH